MKDIPGYEGLYSGTEDGHIWSRRSKKILKESIDKDGYRSVSLYKNKHSKKISVHRLICMTYHENPENKPTVNHKNHIVNDNRPENLNWATYPEQCDEIRNQNLRAYFNRPETHEKISKATRGGNNPNAKLVRCIETGVSYSCQRIVEFYFNVSAYIIQQHLNGHKSDINGFHFERI